MVKLQSACPSLGTAARWEAGGLLAGGNREGRV